MTEKKPNKILRLGKTLPRIRKRLGEILIDAGLIDAKTLENAIEAQKVQNKKLGQVLIDMGVVEEAHIADVLSRQLGIQYFRLHNVKIQEKAVRSISREMAEKYSVIPLQEKENKLIVAMANPLDYNAIEDIEFAISKHIYIGVSPIGDILNAIDTYYPKKDLKEDIISQTEIYAEMEVLQQAKIEEMSETELATSAGLPPVVRFTNAIIGEALKRRASDIHIEPQIDDKNRPKLIIRYRVDGIMYEAMRTDRHVHPSLVSRIKIMSSLDISERRKPQDGKAQVKFEGTVCDLRISTIPTTYGEKVTIRILNSASAKMGLKDLGFSENDLSNIKEAISRPQGILLVTGPTGSGKSSTLYTCLNMLNTASVNIITVEDPVEFDVAGINQVQINAKAGITFAAGLRSILRQDPDIIMVGEIRDTETAQVAFQAAQTGHLVLSTLHTNDAPSAVTRLLDLGVDDFQISSALIAVIGQRLVRKIHTGCKVQDEVSPRVLERLHRYHSGHNQPVFWKGGGCSTCHNAGYIGRTGLYEILIMTPSLRNLIKPGIPSSELKKAALKQGFHTMAEDGIEKALKGLTSIEEVFRVSPPEVETTPQANWKSPSPGEIPIVDKALAKPTVSVSDLDAQPSIRQTVRAFADETNSDQKDQPIKVLVVDDVEIDRMIICDALEAEDYLTDTAKDGIEALEKISLEKPDLIVLDYMMPRMDGKKVIKELRGNITTRTIPILMLTSLDDVESEISVMKAGADDYISKPVHREKFLIRVENILRRSK